MTLPELIDLAGTLPVLDSEIAAAQAVVDALVKKREAFAHTVLVDAFRQSGLEELTLSDGTKLTLKSKYFGSIPKEGSRYLDAMCWLRDNNHGGIIKSKVEVDVGRDDEARVKALAVLRDEGFLPTFSEGVHNATLTAFINERIAADPTFPKDLFNVVLREEITLKSPRS